MGSTRVFVHTCDVDVSALQASLDIHKELLHGLDMDLGQPMDKDACLRILSDLQVLTGLRVI